MTKPNYNYIFMMPIFLYIILFFINVCNAADSLTADYLTEPSGKYSVAFKDFYWINDDFCPDFNYNGINHEDFSSVNTRHCHEIMANIYYPIDKVIKGTRSSYNKPFIIYKQKEILNQVPNIDKKYLVQLNQLKSYTKENTLITNTKKRFPVLLFAPGFGFPAKAYENYITELVSHGYIVIGINTAFINLSTLPNGNIVEPAGSFTEDELENKFVNLQAQDLLFTLKKIKELHSSNAMFAKMDLNNVGLLGHSLGARVLADIAHIYPTYFKAAATLDIGFDESGKSLKKFTIPLMHIIAADRKTPPPGANLSPIVFELGDNNYLVGITPNEHNINYSSHDNFSDLSTLQNHPALQTVDLYRKHHFEEGFDFIVKSKDPTADEYKKFNKITYILIKKDDKWHFSIYENRDKIKNIDVSMVAGLNEALSQLPNIPPEQLSDSKKKSLKNVMTSLHYILFGKSFLGTGDGIKITNSINTYLLQFFDTFIKGKTNPNFKNCIKLSDDSYMKCGPNSAA